MATRTLPTADEPWHGDKGDLDLYVIDYKVQTSGVALRVEVRRMADGLLLDGGWVKPAVRADLAAFLTGGDAYGMDGPWARTFLLHCEASISQRLAKEAPAPTREGEPELTDTGNSDRFARAFADEFTWSVFRENSGEWRQWKDSHWGLASQGDVQEGAKVITRRLIAQGAEEGDERRGRELIAHGLRSQGEPRIKAMITLAKGLMQTPVDQFDLNPWLLNVANGTLDLRTGELRPHAREDFITRRVAVPYNPGAESRMWRDFLERVQPSAEMRDYVQMVSGYGLTGSTREECLFFAYGTGGNGKGTWLNTMAHLLGEYAKAVKRDTVMTKPGGDGINNDIADLAGSRFVVCTEMDQGRRFSEALLKELTGGDLIKARFLHKEHFSFFPTFKLLFSGNHKPEIRGTDEGIWRRMRLIPFTTQIPDEEKDHELKDKLKDPRELEGILAWAVEGARMWLAAGRLPNPDPVRKATSDYRAEMDVMAGFIDERVETKAATTVTKQGLYDAYVDWCKHANEYTLTNRRFNQALTERGWTDGRSNEARFWCDRQLRGTNGAPTADEAEF